MNTDGTSCAVGKLVAGDKTYDASLVVAEFQGKIIPTYHPKIKGFINNEVITDSISFRLQNMPDAPIRLGQDLQFNSPIYITTLKI